MYPVYGACTAKDAMCKGELGKVANMLTREPGKVATMLTRELAKVAQSPKHADSFHQSGMHHACVELPHTYAAVPKPTHTHHICLLISSPSI